MFEAKQKTLFSNNEKTTITSESKNPFVNAALKKSAETKSGNGALKYKTTGSAFVDQFGLTSTYKTPRSYDQIFNDQSALWGENPMLALCFIFFLRIVTRVVQLFNGNKTTTVQRGAGLKHEAIARMLWLHTYHKDTFWKNISLFISVGSWKDVIQMLSIDLKANGWENRALDWNKFQQLLLAGLENPKTSELVKKYLPQIKANSKCTTLDAQADNVIAKWIASFLHPEITNKISSYKAYRKLKASGTAHQWQQLISKKQLLKLDFNTIHGRALAQLVSSKFLKNNKLEDAYQQWIATKPVAKFTGYVPELLMNILYQKNLRDYHIHTFNAQFKQLVETAKKNAETGTRFITVVDTSSSMDSIAAGIKLSNMRVAQSLALFFTNLLDKGPFAKVWYNFSDKAVMVNVRGATPWEQYESINRERLCCSTNFQAVVDHFCEVKKNNPTIPESEFPNGFLVLSDMEFNQVIGNKTNTQAMFDKLSKYFSKEFVDNFKLVYWNLASSAYNNTAGRKFETFGNQKNVFYFSGYDGSIVAFLTGVEGQDNTKINNAEDLMQAALSQEVMSYLEL